MKIAEIFHSIQGEGELTGVPSVFVRTSGCNLRCLWCDTPYASWHPEGVEMDIPEIVSHIRDFGCPHVVLTGGEPLLAPGVRDLAAAITGLGHHLTIETAGTLPPDGIACDLASLSPKLASSTPPPDRFGEIWTHRHEALRLQPEVLRAWLDGYRCQMKFVVSGPADLDEIATIREIVGKSLTPSSILLMPEGVTPEELAARRDFVIAACKRFGYRYCHRLQIDLFGNTKGT
ncbi:MAG: 7-carboxy-7-deazaguanine synthase QueE [Verrucomicrobia bacterium]|nr:7-carboxy-7-deazaguanine synthase QueE [Verrucomicrobiota bacterium]